MKNKSIIDQSIKLKIIFFYIVICNSLVIGQSNLKTHKVVNGNESLIYNYYQDLNTLQNINHGSYSYTFTSGQDKTIIKGNYLNGLKDGVWTWDVIFYNKYYGGNFDKVTKRVTKTYSKGKRNGLWSYKNTIQSYENGNLHNTFNQELTENFTNNIQTGNLIFIKDKKLPIKLKFNKKGALLGNYLLPFGSSEVLIKTNEFGVATDFFDKNDINETAIEVGNKYSFDSITQDEAKELNIDVRKKELIEWFYDASIYNSQIIEDPKGGEDLKDLTFGYLIHSKHDTYLLEEKKRLAIRKEKEEREEQEKKELALKKDIIDKENKKIEEFSRQFIGTYTLITKTDKIGKDSYQINFKKDENYFIFDFKINYVLTQSETFIRNVLGSPNIDNVHKHSVKYDYDDNIIKIGNDLYKYTIKDRMLTLESDNYIFYLSKKINP
ncbi:MULTISPECIES: hypothetical protein [unclassified Empedobacter]|uniref:hypothetical protein n=1 Tax=unclassified Empedobacter TaxID=2643773 RepID=UPI0025C4B480|nr:MULTISPECIES: hypothetical protein [unclassified Empedobacter]